MVFSKTPILLVDDKAANIDALEAVLESRDYELVTAISGAEALEQFERQEFAVILLDVQMPTMSGVETAQRIRKLAAQLGRRAPIIFVTAIDMDQEGILRAYDAGAVDIVQKPFEAQILRAKVAVFADLH